MLGTIVIGIQSAAMGFCGWGDAFSSIIARKKWELTAKSGG